MPQIHHSTRRHEGVTPSSDRRGQRRSPAPTHAALWQNTIKREYGPVTGAAALNETYADTFSNWQDISVWKGIPIAASTGGQNRWKPPQPHGACNTTLAVTSFGDDCVGEDGTTCEDCLSRNIRSPATSANESLPVSPLEWGRSSTPSTARSLRASSSALLARAAPSTPYDPDLSGYGSDCVNVTYAESCSTTYTESLNCIMPDELRELTVEKPSSGTGVDAFFGGLDPVLDYWAIPSRPATPTRAAPSGSSLSLQLVSKYSPSSTGSSTILQTLPSVREGKENQWRILYCVKCVEER